MAGPEPCRTRRRGSGTRARHRPGLPCDCRRLVAAGGPGRFARQRGWTI